MSSNVWTVAEAKAHFSAVIEEAEKGQPQTITRRGRVAAVIVSIQEWEKKVNRSGSLADFFQESPLKCSELTLERQKDSSNGIDL